MSGFVSRASIDLMGGDFAPHAVLAAVAKIQTDNHNVHFILVGDASCKKLILEHKIQNYTFIEAAYKLEEAKKVTNAELESSSLYIAIMQVKNGNADFVVSAGPSGYYLLLAKRILGTIHDSLVRPALAAIIPTAQKPAIMLDLGANITCTGEDLVHFAIMGSALAKFWLDYKTPRVGFINVGSELGKGPDSVKNAAQMYEKLSPDMFAGFIEGNNMMKGDYDVIVADGFVGNCMLKLGEGMMGYVREMLRKQFRKNAFSKVLGILLKRSLKKALFDPKKFNGAIFAGVNGCVIKSHGGSDVVAFISAIGLGVKIAPHKDELLQNMQQEFALLKSDVGD